MFAIVCDFTRSGGTLNNQIATTADFFNTNRLGAVSVKHVDG